MRRSFEKTPCEIAKKALDLLWIPNFFLSTAAEHCPCKWFPDNNLAAVLLVAQHFPQSSIAVSFACTKIMATAQEYLKKDERKKDILAKVRGLNESALRT